MLDGDDAILFEIRMAVSHRMTGRPRGKTDPPEMIASDVLARLRRSGYVVTRAPGWTPPEPPHIFVGMPIIR